MSTVVYVCRAERWILCRSIRKILNTKIFDDDKGKKWGASVADKKYEILCISQFTLYHVLKGNKLDFHRAMPAQESEPFYMNFLAELRKKYVPELVKGNVIVWYKCIIRPFTFCLDDKRVVQESWNFIFNKFMQMVSLVLWWKFAYRTVDQLHWK